MITIGVVKSDKKMQALSLFSDICIQNNLKLSNDEKINCDILTIEINYEDFINKKYNFLNFDIIIFENCGIIEKTINKDENRDLYVNVLVVNLDDKNIFKLLNGFKAKLITFGLNSKSCVTVSSIQNDYGLQEIEFCIQRTIPTLIGTKIEPQEFKLTLNKYKEYEIYISLAAVSLAIICGIEVDNIQKIAL